MKYLEIQNVVVLVFSSLLSSPLLSVSTDSEIEQESVMEIDIDTILGLQ